MATTTQKTGEKNNAKAVPPPQTGTKAKLAVVLVRGLIDLNRPTRDTLQALRLHRKNHCVVIADTPVNRGMINHVKDLVAWGTVTEETFGELVAKRGIEFRARQTDSREHYHYRCLEYQGKKYKPYFALNPPLKGFGRKGIKVAFRAGGALGNRGEKINDLLKRMM